MNATRIRMTGTLALRSLLWIWIVALVAALSARAFPREQQHGKAQISWGNSGHFFFGTSPDPKLGTMAWLFCIDKEHHAGQIFAAPRMIGFSQFNLANDGRLMFRSVDFFGKSYRFNGTLNSGKIAGAMELVDVKSGNPEEKWQLTAILLPPQTGSGGHAVSPRRYSNLNYSAEGGDFTGVDISFFTTPAGTTGIIVFYESYWGEPTFTPLALTRIETNDGVIRFAAETPSGVARYHLQRTPTGALFNRDDLAHERGEKGIVLKRSRSLLTVAPRVTTRSHI